MLVLFLKSAPLGVRVLASRHRALDSMLLGFGLGTAGFRVSDLGFKVSELWSWGFSMSGGGMLIGGSRVQRGKGFRWGFGRFGAFGFGL